MTELKASGFFVLRTPLLPLDVLGGWGTDGSDPRELLRRLASRPEVAEALWLASPELAARWKANTTSEGPLDRTERAVAAYLVRAATRSTPFGLFAGVATGTIGTDTGLRVPPMMAVKRRTRLDMGVLAAIAERVERDSSMAEGLLFSPTTSLYRAAGRLRYVEARTTGSTRSHHLVAVDEDDALRDVLRRAAGGSRLDELVSGLVDDGASAEEAREYVRELVDAGLLVSDVQPAVTGTGESASMTAALSRSPATKEVANRLETVRASLAGIDRAGPGQSFDQYRSIEATIRQLVSDVDPARLVQVDMTKPTPGLVLGGRHVSDIYRSVALLHRITPRQPDPMREFRSAFEERYGTAELALAEVLDEETGIGYQMSAHPVAEESPLLANLDLGLANPRERTWSARDAVLLRLLTNALSAGVSEIELGAADIDELTERNPLPLPDALSVMATVLGDGRVVLHGIDGPSGAALLGRFCGGDDDLTEAVRQHMAREQALRPDAIFAEVVHLPEGRIGNILRRPVLRDYELVYLGRSGAAEDRQITLDDLRVRIEGDRIVLRSMRHDREVVPRLTTAHNTSYRSLGLYRFLADLQRQGVATGLRWDWGPLAEAPFLPRVTVGRLVLERAQWRLTAAEVDRLRDYEDVVELRAARRLPRMCVLAEGDNELIVDLDSPPWVQVMLRSLRRGQPATLVEAIGFESPAAAGPEGRFAHELIVPFLRGSPADVPRFANPTATLRRNFPPGSEWLYLKAYTGTSGADAVLRALGPVLRDTDERWFFVRYADPQWHVRVRVFGAPDVLREHVQPSVLAALSPLVDDGTVWRIQLDTYQREVERYGGDQAMLLAERAFHADSVAALRIMEMLAGDAGLDARWRLTLAGTDRLLDNLGFDMSDRAGVVRRQRAGFGAEFPGGATQSKELGRRFRAERGAVGDLLDRTPGHPLEGGLAVFDSRSTHLRRIGDELRTLDRAGQLGVTLADWAASLAHMHANRMLRSAHRAQELVIHDLLDRHYRSRLARGVD